MSYAKKRLDGESLGSKGRSFTWKGISHLEKTEKLRKVLREVTRAISDLDPYRQQMDFDAGELYGMKFNKEGALLIQASEKLRMSIAKLKALENLLEQTIEKMD